MRMTNLPKEKRTINDIFEKSGEEYFRKIEKQTLKEIKNILY